jgi:Peptidase A4 family
LLTKFAIAAVALAGLALAGLPAAIPATAQAATAGAAGSPTAATAPGVTVHSLRPLRPLRRALVTLPRTELPHLRAAVAVAYSGNWSGYADSARQNVVLRYVQADWKIPQVNCALSSAGSAGQATSSDWVGLDGYSSTTVEQTGTTTVCDGSLTPHYYAWYEMYPLNPVAFSDVGPGDAVDAAVYFNGSAYTITPTDLTSGGQINVTQKCPAGSRCQNSSAEVITEDPGRSAPEVGLADFGQATFTAARVTSRNGTHGTLGTEGLWTSARVQLEDTSNGHMLATAGLLRRGRAFVETWLQSL